MLHPGRSRAAALLFVLLQLSLRERSAAGTEWGRPPSPEAVALQQAVDAAVRQGGGLVEVPVGVPLRFGNRSLYVDGASDLVLDGRGALLIFEPGHGVLVSRSHRVVLRNTSVDYDPPCFSQGTATVPMAESVRLGVISCSRKRMRHSMPTETVTALAAV